jgi:hypothetical protein
VALAEIGSSCEYASAALRFNPQFRCHNQSDPTAVPSPPWNALSLERRPVHRNWCAKELADYLRDQAVMYRKLAEQADDPVIKNEMLELASVCEEVANNIEDHLTGG